MTINVVLVTSEAIVFGCDSTSSTTEYLLDFLPFLDLDSNGAPIVDEDGRFSAKFRSTDLRPVVTNAWGGVTKMFSVSEGRTPVVAVTAGVAKLNDRTMASLGSELRDGLENGTTQPTSIEYIVERFLAFFREQYDQHYSDSQLPQEFREGPEFLVGGYGKDARFPALFRVDIMQNSATPMFKDGRTGVSWNGQADAVERVLNGYDSSLISMVNQYVEQCHESMTDGVREIISSLLETTGTPLPEGFEFSIPLPESPQEGFLDLLHIDTDFSNLPLQEAVNMVSYLVLVQAGKARFERGVATVGGRTHVGVITKEQGFRILNEPELTHPYTGFSNDPQ